MVKKIKYSNLITHKNNLGFTHTPKTWVSGFTLVEMIVAIGLFSVIASMSIGAVLTIFDANKRSENSKTVVDNLNLTIEDMTRTIRFGQDYDCGPTGGDSNCSAGSDTISLNFRGDSVVYKKCGSVIKKSTTGQTNCNSMSNVMTTITSNDTFIQDLKFFVLGVGNVGTERYKQPYVIAVIKGYVGPRPSLQSSFFIQTMMSQRIIEYD